jgi:hypothetical protein
MLLYKLHIRIIGLLANAFVLGVVYANVRGNLVSIRETKKSILLKICDKSILLCMILCNTVKAVRSLLIPSGKTLNSDQSNSLRFYVLKLKKNMFALKFDS